MIAKAHDQPAAARHHPPRAARRVAPRRLRHPLDAPGGEGVDAGGDGRDGGLRLHHPRDAERQPAARHAAPARPRSTASIPTTSCRWCSRMPEWPKINSEIFMHTVVPNLKRLGLITERTEAALAPRRHHVRRSLRAGRGRSKSLCRRRCPHSGGKRGGLGSSACPQVWRAWRARRSRDNAVHASPPAIQERHWSAVALDRRREAVRCSACRSPAIEYASGRCAVEGRCSQCGGA